MLNDLDKSEEIVAVVGKVVRYWKKEIQEGI